ncbi:MAG TPA: putative Ig domain-containing protein [Hyalangium sp.]|nr:putative Ig domain-containing protein [Hyalangium sp.]
MSSVRLLAVLLLATLLACDSDPATPDTPGPALPSTSLGESTAGAPFSRSLAASGGTAPLTYSAQGLPAGIALDPQTGTLAGSPSSPGSFDIAASVTDAAGRSDQRSYPLLVLEAPRFVTASLPPATATVSYAVRIEAAGGKAPLAYGPSGGALPPGLAIDASGTLSGTPSAPGTYSFELSVTDAHGSVQRASFTLEVRHAPPIIATSELTSAHAAREYRFTFSASGGTPPYSWSKIAGELPSGLTLSTEGELIGTPALGGTFSFTLEVHDAQGQSAQKPFSLVVIPPLAITTSGLPEAYRGRPYQAALEASGGVAPYTYSLAGGALPSGLQLDTAGRFSGTPSVSGSFGLTLAVEDGSQHSLSRAFTLTVLDPPGFASSTLGDGVVGVAYSDTFQATGGKPPFTFRVTSGALPAGLQLSGNVITGTPTTVGTASFTVEIRDANGQTGTQGFSLRVSNTLTITSGPLPDAYTDGPYAHALSAAGGRLPYRWALVSGSLPPGIGLSTSGQLSGTPSTPGGSTFTVSVTDSLGSQGSRTLSLAVYRPPSVGPATLSDAYVSEFTDLFFTGVDGRPPYTFSLASGVLPAGLSLAASGQLTGTPTAPGNASFTIAVSDANGRTGTRPYTLAVYTLPTLTTTTLPEAGYGQPYAQTLTVSGGKPGYSFVLESGSLPAGITLSSGGQLTGSPTGSGSSFTVRVFDANSRSYARTLTLFVSIPDGGPLFTVGHWNIEWFGSDTQGPPRSTSPGGTPDDLQIANVRNLISDAGVNLWGFVEMTDTADFQALKAQLPGYNGFLSNDPIVALGSNYYSASEQKLGVLYDSRLTFQSATLILTSWATDFAGRPPMRVDFTTSIQGSSTPLTLIVLHMKAFDDQVSYDRRQRAGAALKSYLDSALPSSRVFVVGDWNDDVDVSITHDGGVPLPSPYENFLAAPNDYTFITRPLSLAGEGSTTDFPDMIDHTLASNEVVANYVPNSVHVLRPTWIPDYGGTTSDHYPVLSRYAFDSPSPPPPPIDANPDAVFVPHTDISATGSSPGRRANGSPF